MKLRSNRPLPRDLRIFVAHDDSTLRLEIAEALVSAGYRAVQAFGTARLFESIPQERLDLLLLEAKATGVAGCGRLRRLLPHSGIVALIPRDSESGDVGSDTLALLEAGADDYLALPFHPGELHARLCVVFRRIGLPRVSKVLRLGDMEVDFERRCLQRGGESIHLTRREFDLLSLLMQRAGTPLTHVHLLRSVWGPEYGEELEYLRVYIGRLRRKLELDPARPNHILTEPGIGYYFQEPLT